MKDLHRVDRVLTLGLVALLVAVGVISFRRAAHGDFDFRHFYADARYVWEHRELNPHVESSPAHEQRQLPFYLPVVPLVLAPLTALGRVPAALIWAAAQVAALGYSLSVLRKWGDDHAQVSAMSPSTSVPARREGRRYRAGAPPLLVATVLALPAIIEAATFNQLSFFVLALLLSALRALERDRPRRAGMILGISAVLKLLPIIFLPWLVLKRRWLAALAMVLTTILASVLPCVVVFGPRQTLDYHRQWWAYNVQGEAGRGLVSPELREHFLDHHNQSIAQVVARLAWPEHPFRAPWPLARLSLPACARLAYGIAGVLFAVLLWQTRRPWRDLTRERQGAEAAVYALAMLVLSPLLRQYYLVWALPALVWLARLALRSRADHGAAVDGRRAAGCDGSRRTPLGWAGLIIWLVGMLAWLSPTARLYGAHLVMLILMGAMLLWATYERRTSVNSVISGRQLNRT